MAETKRRLHYPGRGAAPHQRRFHDILSPKHGSAKRGTSLVGGLGSGKTLAGAWQAITMALILAPYCLGAEQVPVLVGVPDFPQARGASFGAVLTLLRLMGLREDAAGLSGYRVIWSGGRNEIAFLGTRIAWISAEHPHRAEGWECGALWIDEPDSCPAYAQAGFPLLDLWTARVRLAAKPEAGTPAEAPPLRYWLTGTPKGMLRLWEAHHGTPNHPPLAGIQPWVQARTEDNPHWAGTDYATNLRSQYTGRLAKALLDGEFVDLSEGQAYEAFERARNVRPCPYTPGQPLLLTCDFNRSPMAWLAAQRTGDGVVVVREFLIRQTYTAEAAGVFADWARRIGHRGQIDVYGDATGASRRTVSPQSDYEILVPALQAAGFQVSRKWRVSNTAVVERVAAVNAALKAGRVAIDPSCDTLVRDLTQVRYKAGTTTLDQSAGLTHASDALGYLVQEIFSGLRFIVRDA